MRPLAPALLVLALPAVALAHPHSRVDQQGLLSIGRTKAVLTFAIVPSTKDGAHMFGHLDSNRDGILGRSEQTAFATELLSKTSLSVNGAPVRLRVTSLDFPDRRAIASGKGMIRITTGARVSMPAAKAHKVALRIDHNGFAKTWLLQAFYFSDLTAGGKPPTLDRKPAPGGIMLAIPRQ